MSDPNHIMIDLETAGTRPGSAILTIGAIRFDPTATNLIGIDDPSTLPSHTIFYRPIDRRSCDNLGLTDDQNTLAWWRRQSPQSRFEAFDRQPRHDIGAVFSDFGLWCGHQPKPWSHGANFDIVMCDAIFEKLKIPPPWRFWDIRDTRTLFDFTGTHPRRDSGSHHHALHDALAQAAAVQTAYKKHKGA